MGQQYLGDILVISVACSKVVDQETQTGDMFREWRVCCSGLRSRLPLVLMILLRHDQ